jgi:opacity protein-like surface antigen
MRGIKLATIAATSALAFTAAAVAADLTEAQLKDLLVGKTVYLQLEASGSVTGAGGTGVIYYSPEGTAIYKTPKGEIWNGPYTFKGNTQCTEWKQATTNACTRYDKQGDIITLYNVTTGIARGKLAKTAPGNAEGLK